MVKYLVEKGAKANLEQPDAQMYTPLMTAVQAKKVDICELLLKEYKVDPDVSYQTSALFLACQEGYLPTTRVLLENGANPDIWHEEMGITPLHIAVSNDHIY